MTRRRRPAAPQPTPGDTRTACTRSYLDWSAPNASLLRRLLVLPYEFLLLLGVCAALWLLPHMLYGMATGLSTPPWFSLLHALSLLGLYFVWFWTHGGQTAAMKTWRIRLIDARSGADPSRLQALARYLLCWPSWLFFGVGLIWAVADREHQFLHDRLCATRLIDCR